MLLKEYLPGARAVAANELQMLVHLCDGLPARKWHAANAPMAADLPIVPILGAQHPFLGLLVTPGYTSCERGTLCCANDCLSTQAALPEGHEEALR